MKLLDKVSVGELFFSAVVDEVKLIKVVLFRLTLDELKQNILLTFTVYFDAATLRNEGMDSDDLLVL